MKRQLLMILLTGILVFVLIAGFKSGAATSLAKSNASGGAVKAIGQADSAKASDFSLDFILADLNGQKIKLSDIIKNNKVTLVNFWATWCPPCREEIPDLINFYSKYSTQKVSLLGIDIQEGLSDVKAFVTKNKMNYPVLIDTDGKVAELYKIYAIPTTFFIDANGKIRDKIEGGTDLETLETKVKEILKGQ